MCDKPATWDVTYGYGPDDYTQSCDGDLAEMLRGCIDDARKNGVTLQVWPTDPMEGHEPATCCYLTEEEEAKAVGRAACGHVNGSGACKTCEYKPDAATSRPDSHAGGVSC